MILAVDVVLPFDYIFSPTNQKWKKGVEERQNQNSWMDDDDEFCTYLLSGISNEEFVTQLQDWSKAKNHHL
jgi:hypothetical protein